MKWISIKDKLPDVDNEVSLGLVYDDDGGEPHVFICGWMDFSDNGRIYYKDSSDYWIDFKNMNNDGMASISHWMPLPPPPEDV